ncbi:MAG: hypothetical protein HUK06_02405 [Bacteroidaceae bacterium]|nr:hypothetical protein [Bacteroidaceae bacterium]
MKLTKILGLALVMLAMASCSKDQDWSWNGKNGATVEMMETEISFKENKGIVKVPIKVVGERDGRIQATVEFKATGNNPATEDKDYYVTAKYVNISEKDSVGYVELRLVDNDEINEAKTFEVSLVDVQHASKGQNTKTTVYIKDNDASFYEKLQGEWTIEAIDAETEAPVKWSGNIIGYDEGEKGYDEVLHLTCFYADFIWIDIPINYSYDTATNKIMLDIPLGSVISEGFDFGDFIGDTYLGAVEGQSVTLDGNVEGKITDDLNTITFNPDCLFIGAVYNGPNYMGWIFLNQGMTLKRGK